METDLELALRAAVVGAAVALPHFNALADLPRETKADGSVVTAADRAVENAIREVLAAARPGDAVLGEEYGLAGPAAGRRWIIDPIDGTALFVAGDDRWLVLIGLEEDGEMVAGVAAHPAQGSVWWASRGGGAFEGRIVGGRVVAATPIAVTPGPAVLAGARFAAVPEDWHPHLIDPLAAVTDRRKWAIHPGLLVARGDLDVALQTGGQIWDFAATSLIVTEAGGSYGGLDGRTRPGPGASVYARTDALRRSAIEVVNAGQAT